MTVHYLGNRAVISLTGKDAKTYLQGIITNNIEKASEDNLLYSLILTPQGKFLFEIFLLKSEDGYLIDCFADCASDLELHLKKFRLRSAIEILQKKELGVFYSEEQGSDMLVDPRSSGIGYRAIKLIDGENLEDSSGKYHEYLVSKAVLDPHNVMEEGRAFPLNFGMDKFNAISFDKGCYIGQELTARMKHRKMIRKKIAKAKIPAGDTSIKGEDINFDGKTIGKVIDINPQGDIIAQIDTDIDLENKIKCYINQHETFLEVAF